MNASQFCDRKYIYVISDKYLVEAGFLKQKLVEVDTGYLEVLIFFSILLHCVILIFCIYSRVYTSLQELIKSDYCY